MVRKTTTQKNSTPRRAGIFIAAGLVVLMSTLLLYAFVRATRAAASDTTELVDTQLPAEELELPEEAETPAPPPPSSTPTPVKEYERGTLPNYELQYTEDDALWMEPYEYLLKESITMEEAADTAVYYAIQLFGAAVENAVVTATPNAWPTYNAADEEIVHAAWQISVYCTDRETMCSFGINAKTGRIGYASLNKDNYDYMFDDGYNADSPQPYFIAPAYLSAVEYEQAVRDGVKQAKILLEDHLLNGRNIIQIELYTDNFSSQSDYYGGNDIGLAVYFSENDIAYLTFLARKGEGIQLISMSDERTYAE